MQAYLNRAHGSHGHLHFEWRRPLAGNEQYRPSFIKGFDGEINPLKPVFERIGREFAELGPITFVLNLTATPHRGIKLPHAMRDCLNGEREVRSISLEPLDVAVLAATRQGLS